jgi:hypothetical protein
MGVVSAPQSTRGEERRNGSSLVLLKVRAAKNDGMGIRISLGEGGID